MIDESVSQMIGAIYRSVHARDAWDRVMENLAARFSARWMMVAPFDEEARHPLDLTFYRIPNSRFADGMAQYAAEGWRSDPTNHFAARNPRGGIFDSRNVAVATDYFTNDYVRWNQANLSSAYWQLHYSGRERMRLGVALHRGAEDGPMGEEDTRLLSLLFGHMVEAARLGARPPDIDAADPIIVLNGAGEIIASSESADRLLDKRDGIMRDGLSLQATDRRSKLALDAAIRSALSRFDVGSVGGAAALARMEGPDLLATVSHLPTDNVPLRMLRPAVLIRLIDRSKPAAPLKADWRALFHLTAAENRLARALVENDTGLRETAEGLGIAYATARVQLAALFDKTGARSQIELVKLLIRLG